MSNDDKSAPVFSAADRALLDALDRVTCTHLDEGVRCIERRVDELHCEAHASKASQDDRRSREERRQLARAEVARRARLEERLRSLKGGLATEPDETFAATREEIARLEAELAAPDDPAHLPAFLRPKVQK